MPKTLRYGLAAAAVMGILCLTTYVFRNYITEWVRDMYYYNRWECAEPPAALDDVLDGEAEQLNPFE